MAQGIEVVRGQLRHTVTLAAPPNAATVFTGRGRLHRMIIRAVSGTCVIGIWDDTASGSPANQIYELQGITSALIGQIVELDIPFTTALRFRLASGTSITAELIYSQGGPSAGIETYAGVERDIRTLSGGQAANITTRPVILNRIIVVAGSAGALRVYDHTITIAGSQVFEKAAPATGDIYELMLPMAIALRVVAVTAGLSIVTVYGRNLL